MTDNEKIEFTRKYPIDILSEILLQKNKQKEIRAMAEEILKLKSQGVIISHEKYDQNKLMMYNFAFGEE